MNMVLCVATLHWEGWLDSIKSWYKHSSPDRIQMRIVFGKEILVAYQECYVTTNAPILSYIHDDVEIYEENWDLRVLKEFDDPKVGVVGFGGALGHGVPNLYHVPYYLPNLARQQFMSNMRSAEKHGSRFTGERDVVILDGYALFLRREILDKVGGWPVGKPYGYFLYSEWLCCEARRQGFRIRMVGVDSEHLGGRSSFSGLKDNYEEAHRYLFENNRDVLPARTE